MLKASSITELTAVHQGGAGDNQSYHGPAICRTTQRRTMKTEEGC